MISWLCPKCNQEIIGEDSEDVMRKAEHHMAEHNLTALDRIRQLFSRKKKEEDLENMT